MSIRRIDTIDEMRRHLDARRAGSTIGLVPTMGALHAGHGHLIERARAECHTVAVSIFVNPLQFDRQDDLDRYPRTLDADMALCSTLGADVVFVPAAAEMYPSAPRCMVDVVELGEHLCGRFRPGHFRGVATVVLKLFEIVQPQIAYFGEKDAQQLAIIRRMVADLNVPVSISGVDTVREPDGLAMSSRNKHLTQEERTLAPWLYRALQTARTAIEAGEGNPSAVRALATAVLPEDPRLRLEYFETVHPSFMQPVTRIDAPVLVAAALWVGSTRLIDNVRCAPPTQS